MDESLAALSMVENLVGVAAVGRDDGDGSQRLAFREAADEMRRAGELSDGVDALLGRLAAIVQDCVSRTSLLYYQREEARPEAGWLRPMRAEQELPPPAVLTELMTLCAAACRSNTAQIVQSEDETESLVVVPLAIPGRETEAVSATVGDASWSSAQVSDLLQLAAAQIIVCHSRQAVREAVRESETWTAILDLIGQLETSADATVACQSLANHLEAFLDCQRVAVGLRVGRSRHCRVRALSGLARFDKHAEMVTAIEAAMDEALLKDETIEWPAISAERQAARSHEQLATLLAADQIVTAPFFDDAGEPTGVWLFVNPGDRNLTSVFVRAARQPIGSCLRWLQRSRGGLLNRARRWAAGQHPQRRAIVAACAIGAVVLGLAWPRPHKIGCDCQLQPVVRQFVAAPYEGTLADSLAKAGDVVSKGEVLAAMDGREIRLELAAVEAEYGRAKKSWEASLAADEVHDAQQARLEMRRLQLKQQLLEQRQQNLNIRSPLRGVVVRGDLEKSKGAPLSMGQSLFEIAPLDRMNVEIVVPEEDISYVRPGMEVRIRLEAYPRKAFTAQLTRIVPQAEINDDRLVFLAEAELENAAETLRPGMNGRATLIGRRRSTIWLLFHKPYESLLMLLGV